MKEHSSGIDYLGWFRSLALLGFGLPFLLVLSAAILWLSTSDCFAAEPVALTLDHTMVPAQGRQQALLTTKAFGRYAVFVKSSQGTAIQLVDRMTGSSEIAGAAGEEDGRLDLFLDRGQYKIITRSPIKGSGKAQIEARAFTERNGPKPPLLVELKPINASLNDYEQLSFWLEVKNKRWVALEAAGRNLADLRLWKDGSWLVDASPTKVVLEPKVGQPLLACQLAANLEPGLYLLTAYGGKGQAWAEDSKEHPFHLRFGTPTLATAGRSHFVASPFGTNRWLVPGDATFFRVELPEARPVSFTVGQYIESNPFSAGGTGGNVQKDSVPPVAEIDVSSLRNESYHLVTVRAEAGQPFVLQHFEKSTEYRFRADGDYWISTVNTGHPSDAIDATGILQQWKGGEVHREPFQEKMPEISGSRGWARRANLLDTLTVFLRVSKAGTYEILSKGTEARFRIEPFLTYRPRNYQSPPPAASGSFWDLDVGYYVFTAEPIKKGILDVVLRPKGLADYALDLLGMERKVQTEPLAADVRFPNVHLESHSSYILYLNRRPEVKSGIVLRRLPIDLARPLPLTLIPGELIKVPTRIEDRGAIRVQTEDGSLLDVSLEGGHWGKTVLAEPGIHTVWLKNSGKSHVVASLMFKPSLLLAETPLPPLPDATLAALPKFPVLSEESSRFFDLKEGGTATFSVRSDKPGLYRLETTGLLVTEGNLRSRTVTSLDRQTSNGVGRNFLVQQFLREGDYQVTVAAQGKSAGHAGLSLTRTDPIEGGELAEGIPARITLPAGRAVVYKFAIRNKGRYHLQSLGGKRISNCRLENSEGWPVEKPNLAADFDRIFEPDKYRLVLLPESVESRRVTLLDRISKPSKFKGHGPHLLPLEQSVEHLWREPQPGKERLPDQWGFLLPAPAEISVELTGEMEGILYALGEDGSRKVAQVPPGRGWRGKLNQGRYRLDAVCSRKNNRVNYRVGVIPKEMLPGFSRQISAPTVMSLSVPSVADGVPSLIDLWSYGPADLRARLFDAKGSLVAQNDDRPDDWNFQITQRLSAGMYTLQVEPIGVSSPGQKAKKRFARASRPKPAEVRAEESPRAAVPQGDTQEEQTPSAEEESGKDEGLPEEKANEAVTENEPEGTEAPTAALPPGKTVLHFDILKEVMKPALAVPTQADVRPGNAVYLYPLALPDKAEFLVLSVRSGEAVGVAVEMPRKGVDNPASNWKTIATAVGRQTRIELPIPTLSEAPDRQYRLRVWSTDRRGSPVRIQVFAPTPTPLNEQSLSKGVTLDSAQGLTPPIAVARVSLDRPGVFRIDGVRASPYANVQCEEVKGNLVEAIGNVLWLVRDIAPEKSFSPARLTGSRFALPYGSDMGVALPLQSENSVFLDMAGPRSGPVLSVATSRAGQPGIRVMDRFEAPAFQPSDRAMAVGPHSALSVSLNPREPIIALWSAETKEPSASSPMDVRVHSVAISPPDKGILSPGANRGSVSPGSARAFDLAEGEKLLRIVLGEGLVGVLSRNNTVVDILWAAGNPSEEILPLANKDINRLTLLQPGSGEGHFAVDLLPGLPGEDSGLAPGGSIEKETMESGLLRLRILSGPETAGHSIMLRVRGADADAFLITTRGRVLRGSEIPVPPGGGTLFVHHKPGLILIWMDRTGEAASDLWRGFGTPKQTDVTLPARVALTGKAQLLRLNVPEPSVLHLRAATPAITIVKRGADASGPIVEVHPDGCSLEVYLPKGPAELGLRALAGRSLYGEATMTTTSVTPIGEGPGPEVILPSGGARVFSFQVKRKGPVGIGVRAEADVVESILLDSSGKKVGTGVVQMPLLEPGNYFLILKAPADGPPLRARPALAGVEPPGTGPPPEILREYLEKANTGRDNETDQEGGRP